MKWSCKTSKKMCSSFLPMSNDLLSLYVGKFGVSTLSGTRAWKRVARKDKARAAIIIWRVCRFINQIKQSDKKSMEEDLVKLIIGQADST